MRRICTAYFRKVASKHSILWQALRGEVLLRWDHTTLVFALRFSFVFILQPGTSSPAPRNFHHGAEKFFPGAVVEFLGADEFHDGAEKFFPSAVVELIGAEKFFPGAVVEFLGAVVEFLGAGSTRLQNENKRKSKTKDRRLSVSFSV